MSSTHDVVEIATDDVRVPVSQLTPDQRVRLFKFYHTSISRHYHTHRGGSSFVPWEDISLKRFGSSRNEMRLDSEDIDELKKRFWPEEKEYNSKTRMTPLFIQKFFLPDLSPPCTYRWIEGAEVVCARICLTQTGALYLEWYTGKQIKSCVEVSSSEYLTISTSTGDCEGNKRLAKLLEIKPDLITRFGHQILILLHEDATERERRAERDRGLFNELNTKGKLFDITHNP